MVMSSQHFPCCRIEKLSADTEEKLLNGGGKLILYDIFFIGINIEFNSNLYYTFQTEQFGISENTLSFKSVMTNNIDSFS